MGDSRILPRVPNEAGIVLGLLALASVYTLTGCWRVGQVRSEFIDFKKPTKANFLRIAIISNHFAATDHNLRCQTKANQAQRLGFRNCLIYRY